MSLAIASLKEQLKHIATALLDRIHDVFPPSSKNEEDSISYKRIQKHKVARVLQKDLLGFIVDGKIGPKTIWIDKYKKEAPCQPPQVDQNGGPQ